MIDKLSAEFEESLPLFNRRQQFFKTKWGKSESLYTYLVKLQLSAMAEKLDSLTLDNQLIHKCMADEGVTFHKQVVQLKKNPTYKDLLLITRFDEEKKNCGRRAGMCKCHPHSQRFKYRGTCKETKEGRFCKMFFHAAWYAIRATSAR